MLLSALHVIVTRIEAFFFFVNGFLFDGKPKISLYVMRRLSQKIKKIRGLLPYRDWSVVSVSDS